MRKMSEGVTTNEKHTLIDGDFKTSSLCGGKYFDCVSVKRTETGVDVMDTKTGVTQHYSPGEWGAFIEGVKRGEFDVEL